MAAVDFSIMRRRALENIRHDLMVAWSGTYPAAQVSTTFEAVLRLHNARATVPDFIPILVEAEMLHLLRSDQLLDDSDRLN
ncbi:hypothetical protein RIU96_01190 [Corynebacterium sp. Z-1]|uniref:three-helix bundle dimerization domain-containing protein n=1 Tax=Corynebacterium sp. Z-1 TaxID=3074378 RepID=UPI00288348DF|nr:hypothetical protein [Corynebacterium sp. Z-1]WNI13101.1 hypothetical protein RIU96_01190 [Corynebacterium sp. Z-1]